MGYVTAGQQVAEEALAYFHTGERANGEEYIYTEDAPEWVAEMVREAHGDMMPDDWRYRFVRDVLSHLSDGESAEDVQYASADNDYPYTAERTAWLSSRNDRMQYLDAAMGLDGITGGAGYLLGVAMIAERAEVAEVVSSHLSRRAEAIGLDADD